MNCDCDWPTHLLADCAVHGTIVGCTCGEVHPTMPILWVEGMPFAGVCRVHQRHKPCRGCTYEAEREARRILFGGTHGTQVDGRHETD